MAEYSAIIAYVMDTKIMKKAVIGVQASEGNFF